MSMGLLSHHGKLLPLYFSKIVQKSVNILEIMTKIPIIS